MNESQHQGLLIEWAKYYKEAQYLFAIPNGTHIRSHQGRAKAKRDGLRSGVPDLMLPVARHGFNGLFIELKKPKTAKSPAGKASNEQMKWIDDLTNQGYLAVICVGWEAAKVTIEGYLGEGINES